MKPMSLAETKAAFTHARETLERAAHQAWLHRNSVSAELAAAVNAPMTIADVTPIVEHALDQLAIAQNENLHRNIGPLFCATARDIATEQTAIVRSLAQAAENGEPWVYALAMPTIKANIPAALAALDWPAGALSAGDRAARIAELEPQLESADKAAKQAFADVEELIGHPFDLNAYLEKAAA